MRRRGFIVGLGALIAAPAVIRVADLMKIASLRQTFGLDLGANETTALSIYRGNRLLAIHEITRQSIEIWAQNNKFIGPFDREFGVSGARIGQELRIKLPTGYKVFG